MSTCVLCPQPPIFSRTQLDWLLPLLLTSLSILTALLPTTTQNQSKTTDTDDMSIFAFNSHFLVFFTLLFFQWLMHMALSSTCDLCRLTLLTLPFLFSNVFSFPTSEISVFFTEHPLSVSILKVSLFILLQSYG